MLFHEHFRQAGLLNKPFFDRADFISSLKGLCHAFWNLSSHQFVEFKNIFWY